MRGHISESSVVRVLALMVIAAMTGATLDAAPDVRLVTAAAEQDMAMVRTLLDGGADVNSRRADGATALLWAAHWDDAVMVELLLEAGADVNAADDHGVTPLERAAENANPTLVARLVEAGADPNATQTSGLTPLMTAARTGSVPVVEVLLKAGATVNARTAETGSTPLMWAVSEPHPDVVAVLLEHGADPHTSTTKGFTPLLFASRNGDIAMAETLIAAGVDVNETGSDGTHALPLAILSGQDAFVHFLLGEGADPDGRLGGVPALHAAAGNVGTWLGDWYRRHGRGGLYAGYGRSRMTADRRLQLVKALLEHGADPNSRITSSGMFMSYIGYPRKGAFEPFACGTGDVRGATPLWVAAYAASGRARSFSLGLVRAEGSADIIRALLAAGADQHLTTDDGTTPFMMAAGLGQSSFTPGEPRGARTPSAEEAVRVLLEAGAEINAVNEADFTALHGAAFRGLNEVIEHLVAQGADINARDFRGRTPYRLAEGSKQSFQFQAWPETADLLRQLGANTRLGIPGIVQERLRDVGGDPVQTDGP